MALKYDNFFSLLARRWPALFSWRLHTKKRKTEPQVTFIRHFDGGSSNAAELELAALLNPIYDLNQYGIRFVASPRHAGTLLITGPLTQGMEPILLATFRAMPQPRRVITIGDDFDPDSIFAASYAAAALPEEVAAALVGHIPGNPPTAEVLLEHLTKYLAS